MNLNYSINPNVDLRVTQGRTKPYSERKGTIGLGVICIFGVMVGMPAGMRAQSLQPSSSVASRGGSGSFRIQWTAAPGKPAVALQWNLRLPEGLQIRPDDVAAGSAAESAQKSITCSSTVRKTPGAPDAGYICIVAGGQKPIPDGAVAVILYSIPATMSKGTVRVRIEKALGVGMDSAKIQIADAENTITIK